MNSSAKRRIRKLERLIGPAIGGMLLGALLAPWSSAGGETVEVPSTVPNLRMAAERVTAGDTILVMPGTHKGNFTLPSGVMLKGAEGADSTVIVFSRGHVVLLDGADSSTVIEGITIDGDGVVEAGILCKGEGNPVIRDCVIKDCWFGIECDVSAPLIHGCRIRGNLQGIRCREGEPMLIGNLFENNKESIRLNSGSPTLVGNTFRRFRIGIYADQHSYPVIGGSVESANDFDDSGVPVQNRTFQKWHGVRTMEPAILVAEYNYWGVFCPTSSMFIGNVDFTPWTNAAHDTSYLECPPHLAKPAESDKKD